MDVPLYNTLAYFGSGYLISELCPACLTGISGCFFSLVFLFTCFSFFCSLWLAFQVLPGPCNLHRPGGIPRIALGKEGKKKKSEASWPCGLGGVLVDNVGRSRAYFSHCLNKSHMVVLGSDKKKTIIFEAELLAVILAMRVWSSFLNGTQAVFYIDNHSARMLPYPQMAVRPWP